MMLGGIQLREEEVARQSNFQSLSDVLVRYPPDEQQKWGFRGLLQGPSTTAPFQGTTPVGDATF